MKRACIGSLALTCVLIGCQSDKHVGPDGNKMILPTGQSVRMDQVPTIVLAGRPVDGRLSPDNRFYYVKDLGKFHVIDVASWKEIGTPLATPGGTSLWGMTVLPNGHLLVTSADDQIHEISVDASGTAKLERTIKAPGRGGKGNSFPCGIVANRSGTLAYVCLSLNNQVAELDLATGKMTRTIDVGVAPYDIVSFNGKMYVTCMGGPKVKPNEPSALSAGTPVRVDRHGIATYGSISEITTLDWVVSHEIKVGRQPSAMSMVPGTNTLAVCNTNDDTINFIDTKSARITGKLNVKPSDKLPFGSMPNALGWTPDGKTMLVANAANNALASVDMTNPSKPKINGFIPTHWYPAAIATVGDQILVVNNKGYGSRLETKKEGDPRNSHDKSATLTKIPIPKPQDYAALTEQVMQDGLIPRDLTFVERIRRTNANPVPVPAKLGNPSVFRHVIYVIKENRTYDQVLGDITTGDGEPKLCTFGSDVTPNIHKLAKDYVLLDNFYCNSVLSADGHSWATEGNVTPYLQRAFGGFNRSYTFGDDPITYSSSGFVWDQILDAGYSFRNYGEMTDSTLPDKQSGKAVMEAWMAGNPVKIANKIEIDNLRKYSNLDSPGWNMSIPDQIRMDVFTKEFKQFEDKGNFPNFVTIYLPDDHTGGAQTPRSNVADNDLAVGRLVDAVSHSQFWKDTVIFVVEDDPQAGTDHIDGHRSTALVVSPYTYHRGTDSNFYNQVSVLRTIHQIFGIYPVNQQHLSAPLMSEVFNAAPNGAPYDLVKNIIRLDEYRDNIATLPPSARELIAKVDAIDLSKAEVQTEEDMDTLNRYIWHSTMGWNTRYPSEWAGSHGRGLASKGLKLTNDDSVRDDDD